MRALPITKIVMLIIFAGIIRHGSAQIDPPGDLSPITTNKHYARGVGLGIESYINGDAHGSFYSLRLQFKNGRTTVGLGPCLQKRGGELNGGKISVSYFLTGLDETYDREDPSDEIELRALFTLQYTNKARMSYHASRTETLTNPESTILYNDLRFSTVTATLGPEIDYNIGKVRLRMYAGASFFDHLNYPDAMYRPKIGTALVFGLGVSIPKL